MTLMIADLYQSLCDRMRTLHATPARSDHTGLGAFLHQSFRSGSGPMCRSCFWERCWPAARVRKRLPYE
jgi:hypothetical protein